MREVFKSKRKRRKRSVTGELFFLCFVGYITISIVALLSFKISAKVYEFLCSERTYNREYFNELQYKLDNDYKNITYDDLSQIDGFIVVISKDFKLEYFEGNTPKGFENKVTLENLVNVFGLNKENNNVFLNYDIKARGIIKNFNNSIIENNSGKKYCIYSKYLSSENSLLVLGCPYSKITSSNIITKIIPSNYILKILVFSNIMIILLHVYILAQKASKDFINPIKSLLKSVTEITKGNYEVCDNCNNINEFCELANGVNEMSETIKSEKHEKEKLEKMRKELILDISHDLKNPLYSILGYSETLINSQDLNKEEILEYLNIINQNSHRANKLINDLFQFSLYENKEYKFSFKKIDVCEFLRELIANYISEFDHNGFKYDFEISEDSCYIMIDEENLSRAINNIFDNKIKYNSYGNEIFVHTRIEDGYYYIILGDNGNKIPDDYKENIFNPFIRVDKARNSKTGGTGLGLSITKKIINKHNGNIKILESIVGTNFEIKLPIV